MKPTARDIARICDTSLSAVSRAFRADGAIAPGLRQKILAAAAEAGYAPPARRARAGRQSLSFAILIGELDNPFNPLALKLFAAQSAALGWEMATFIVPETGALDTLMDQVFQADLDAVLLASAELSSTLAAACRERALPVVFFNRIQVADDMTAICTDNYGGGALAAERILQAGRRRVAFVGGRKETSTHLERRRGFIDTLTEAGQDLTFDEVAQFDYDTALDLGHRLFGDAHRPDAVFCANDNMGFAFIDAAHAAGLRPGQDVSIIGYDDVPMARWNRYQLTTISQQVGEMVARSMTALRRVTVEETAPGRIEIVPAKLVLRTSG